MLSKSIHLQQAPGKKLLARLDVPVPYPIARALQRQLPAIFGFTQIRLRLHIVGDIGECSHHAPCGQGLGPDFQRASAQSAPQVVRHYRRGLPADQAQNVFAHGAIHPAGLGSKVTAGELVQGDFRQGGASGHQAFGQVQQLADARVEGDHPALGIDHENTLADAGQGGLKQLGGLRQLNAQIQQLGFGQLAPSDVGVGADHAQGSPRCVPVDDQSAGCDPFPGAVLAAHAQFCGVARCASIKIVPGCGLGGCQVVGVNPVLELQVARADVALVVAQHLFPAPGVNLLTRGHVPVPGTIAAVLQRQPPGILGQALGERGPAVQIGQGRRFRSGRWVVGHVIGRAGQK